LPDNKYVTGSKDGVLGGHKHKFITIFLLPHPFKKINKFKRTARSVDKSEIRAKH